MLLSMKRNKRVFFALSMILLMSLVACANVTPIPMITATTLPSHTPLAPSPVPTTTAVPTNTSTTTLEPDIPPDCMIHDEDGKLYVLSDDVFFAPGPGSEEIDRALENNYPEWAHYEQNVQWKTEPAKLSEIVREASFQEKFALNSEVTLVTLGESVDWQLPSNSDMFSQSLTISERLVRLWDEYSHPDNESIRSNNSEVANGATYALYAFFDYDTEKLRTWCMNYQRLFRTSP